jgi:hypothetical protein
MNREQNRPDGMVPVSQSHLSAGGPSLGIVLAALKWHQP